jgi:GNAT superfamily N-acetyltransferase
MKNIRPCGSKPRDLGVYTTKHGAKLLLDLHNVRLYTKNIAKAKGFCPVIAGFLLGSVMIHRESVTPGHFRLADRGRKDVAKLAKRLGMKLHQLENELEIESVRWHDAVNLTLQNPAKKREWLPPEPGNVGQCDEVEKSLVSWGDIVTDGGDNSCLIETLAVVEKIGLGQKSDIYAEHSCARSSVDRSIKQALARSIPLVQKISTDKAKAHSRHLGLPYRPNRAFYELTETGLSYLCANLEGFHAGRAEQYAAGLTDADFESMERRAVEKDRQQAAYEAELIMEEQRRSAEQRRIRRAETGIPHSPAELEELIAAGLVVRTPAPVAAPAPSEERDWSREGLVPGTLMTPSEAVEAASLGFGPYSPPAPEPSPGPAPTISHALPPSSSSARRPIGPESWRIAPAVDYGTYVTINAEASNGEWAGRIRVLKGLGDDRVFTGLPSSASVMDFVVHPAFRASGLSRALFKAAADYAADRGMVLSSSVHRGMGQEKFWLKQLQGNIARRHDYRSGDHVAVRYALEGPVVPVLANPRRKKQSTVYVIRATCVIPGYANSNAVHYLSGFRDTEGTFSFSRYREKASRFRGLDLAELALHYAQKRIFDQTGQHYPLEIQPELGGHAMRPGCARPAGVR